ncbi:MAG: hypothetical protein HFF44_08425 [Lawsonibacter sp.]|nr:hypothetical protein [Lawsonibacter sp.]
MDERGLWELFCRTGLPEVYLAIAGERQACDSRAEPAKTAFRPRTEQA